MSTNPQLKTLVKNCKDKKKSRAFTPQLESRRCCILASFFFFFFEERLLYLRKKGKALTNINMFIWVAKTMVFQKVFVSVVYLGVFKFYILIRFKNFQIN